MGLQTDALFIRAIREDEVLMQNISGRVYGTAIPLPDVDADNIPAPYVIITNNGGSNDQGTKDDGFESDEDSVEIGIVIAAETAEGLTDLASEVRDTVRNFMENLDKEDEDYSRVPIDYQFRFESKNYNSVKPCYWMEFKYQCLTKRD